MNSKQDPLIEVSLKMGIELAKVHGGSWKQHAKDYYKASMVADEVIRRAIAGNEAQWSAMTLEEKSEVTQEALMVLADRNKVADIASQIGLH